MEENQLLPEEGNRSVTKALGRETAGTGLALGAATDFML